MQTIVIDGVSCNLDEITERANNGDLDALIFLGDIYTLGQYGITAEPAKGWDYYQRAANYGNIGAKFKLGLEYVNGDGYLPLNEKLGIKLLEEAAGTGHKDAQFCLGIYYNNKGKKRKASEYFEMAARQGHAKAQFELGQYWFFEGKNIDNAIYWLCYSNINRNPNAKETLNKMVHEWGVPRANERIQNTMERIKRGA